MCKSEEIWTGVLNSTDKSLVGLSKGFAHFKYMTSGPKNILALTGDRPIPVRENNIPELDVSHDLYDDIVPFDLLQDP